MASSIPCLRSLGERSRISHQTSRIISRHSAASCRSVSILVPNASSQSRSESRPPTSFFASALRRSDRDFGLPRPLLPRNPLRTERAYSRLAKSVLPRPGTTAETYVAYGFTQKLFEACSAQADYRIPQASQKGAQVPKTPAGEDLGVGEGWWYED
ncbi:hypothetical protein M432DRAFT_172731 [Thermoascus aurantiacus ATCC 26904]